MVCKAAIIAPPSRSEKLLTSTRYSGFWFHIQIEAMMLITSAMPAPSAR